MSRTDYLRLLRSTPWREFSLGYGGITLLDEDEIQGGQEGYSVDPQGRSLVGEAEGDWRRSWLVIGTEQTTGDPLFIDLEKPLLPVYTAMHGMGDWQPEPVADSADAFLRSAELVRGVSSGRESPVELERNPLSDAERDAVLRQIESLNPRSDMNFWELLLVLESP
jgi:hypothetical protein